MHRLGFFVDPTGWKRRRATLLAATLVAACLWPDVGASQSRDALEAWTDSALTAAARALSAEEGRLDELAGRNSGLTLPDGRPSSGQAAANIRLWDNEIQQHEAEEGQLRARLADALDRLDPEFAALARRLSPISDSPSPVTGASLHPTSGEFAARVERALDAARNALDAEEGRLDELAARNSRATLPGGGTSTGQAAASIRLWNDAVRKQEVEEARLRARLGDDLERLGPKIASLVNRLNEVEEPDPRSEPPPNGRWTGNVNQQPVSRPYSIVTSLDNCQPNSQCGEVEYPELSCGGYWTFLRLDGDTYYFRETITYGGDHCLDNGLVTLQSRIDGRWNWHYSERDYSGVTASSVLQKSQRAAGGCLDGKSYPDGHGGEVFFPCGDLSFADEVVSFTSGEPKAKAEADRIPKEALGIPDYDGNDNYLTLGCGGVLIVRFTDNSLIDIDGPDLYVFEIGPAVEPTDLAISRDGESWVEIGRIAGGRAEVDVADFVDGPEPYSHVRLIDGRTDCGGEYPGADIDAIGAIGSSPEPIDFGKNEQPLRRESSVLFRRVLSLPGAVLLPRPDASDTAQAEDVTTFSVFYVYEVRTVAGEAWLRVGRSIQRGAEGWIAARQTEEWRNMLVMQFPDRVNRGRVPFFDDERNVRTLLESFRRERDVGALYERLQRGDAPGAIDGLVAVEPAEAIAGDARPYLMPILDWRPNVVIVDTGDIATLVQVAGINAAGETQPTTTGDPDLSELNIGIAFVIDTTRSMGPYIRTAREIVVDFAREIEREGVGRFVDFALVGYRDNTAPNPGIEYVSRIYRDFGGIGDVAALENELAQARISPVSTQDWREDAFAGLRTAIEELSWSPRMAARMIVLITDAGARSGSDPMASNPRYDTLNVRDDAQRRNIAIIPIHLLTAESERHDDTVLTRAVYCGISITAEGCNYIPLPLGDEKVYRAEMQAMVANLHELIIRLSQDEAINAVREDAILPESTRAVLDAVAADASSTGVADESAPKPILAATVQNQIFRAQLQYLGRERGTALPPFYRAWAADLDLANPRYQALDVRVFLTRNQLNELAQVLARLLEEALRSGTSAEALMDSLRHLSAAFATDPNMRTAGDDETLGALLPGFLRELPYRSNIFDLSLRDFANALIQAEIVEELGYKLEQYRRINSDTAGWLDLGSGDPGEFVYPIQLRLLP